MNEHDLTIKVRALLNKLVMSGAPMYFLKVHGGVYQKANQPDVFLCIVGKLYLLETKHPSERAIPNAGQEIEFKKWERAGAIVVTLNNLNDIKRWLYQSFVVEGYHVNPEQAKLLLPK